MLQTTSWAWPVFPVPAGVIPLGKAGPALPTRVLMSISPGGIRLLGSVDGFDQDEAESKRDERAVILRRLLASKCDTLEAFELADRLFDACGVKSTVQWPRLRPWRRDRVREAGDDSAEMLARSGTRPGPELVIYSSANDVATPDRMALLNGELTL